MRQNVLHFAVAFGLVLSLLVSVRPSAVAAASFCDVPPGSSYYDAVTQLAARGVIGGYDNGCFGPNDATLRAQMAALIARAMGWDAEDHGNNFPDRGPVDGNLWRNVGTLAYHNVARGYQDGSYQPTGTVLYAQTISFIARAMVAKGTWQAQGDDPALYPNVPGNSGHRADIATYVANAGSLPGTTVVGQMWANWDQASTRGWFAQALWQAISPGAPSPNPVPVPTPSLTVSPSTAPAGTTFVITGQGFPAGALVGWVSSWNTSGSFQLTAGQTSFTFTVPTDGTSPGAYAVSFAANGGVVGSVGFTVLTWVPNGWQAWHSLPVPGYMNYQGEGPSTDFPGCVQANFITNIYISDANFAVVHQQVTAVWQENGLYVAKYQPGSLFWAPWDQFARPSSTGLVAYTGNVWKSMIIIDCPR